MKSAANRFWPGDVLYSRLRPYLNKVWLADREGLCSAEFIVMPGNNSVDPGFLRYRLNANDFVSFANSLNAGDRPRVDFGQLSPFEFWLPGTLEEQREIVEEIETQLSRLEAGVSALKRAQANLKRYRASVLRSACEGRLVPTEAELARAESRDYETSAGLLDHILAERRSSWSGRGKYKEPIPPSNADISLSDDIPEGWAWATWDQVGFSQNGRPFPSAQYQTTGAKLLRPGNLHMSGNVVWTEDNTRCMPPSFREDNPDLVVSGGELVMNLTAQSLKDEFLGRACLTDEGEDCLLNQRLARLTPILIRPKFALYLLKAWRFRRFVDGLNSGSLIQHMFTSQLATFSFPLPPLAEQARIVAEVERRLSVADRLEATIADNLHRATRLRQSVLQKAFSPAPI